VDVRGFFLAVRKSWWVVILATVIGAAAAVGITSHEAKQYSSSVTFFVATPSAEPGQAYQANLYAQALVNSYVKLLGSDELARRVIAQAGLHATPHAIAGKISGTAGLNTVLLTASATDSTPAGAVRLSSAVASVFGPMVSSLNNNYDTTASKAPVVLSVVSGPTSPVKVAPRRMLNYLLGILVGLVVGLALAALRELTDTSVRSDEQVAAAGTGVLASISRIRRHRPLPLIGGGPDRSILAEEMRQLRTSLQYMQMDQLPRAARLAFITRAEESPLKVIAVVSSKAAEGRSTVAMNLALAFAEAGRQTLLIDADLRRPRIAEYLGIEGAVGLSDVLAQQADLDTALQTWGEQNLHVLASGSLPPHPSELLGSRQMADLVARLRSEFDITIIDTPPLRSVTDGVIAGLLSDGAIVVVCNGRTSRAQLGRALQALRAVDVPVLGAVRNMVPLRRRGRSAHGTYVATRPSDAAADEPEPRTTRGSHDTAGAASSLANANAEASPAFLRAALGDQPGSGDGDDTVAFPQGGFLADGGGGGFIDDGRAGGAGGQERGDGEPVDGAGQAAGVDGADGVVRK
jgi:capsular exopolysaccharide synthesis family protein